MTRNNKIAAAIATGAVGVLALVGGTSLAATGASTPAAQFAPSAYEQPQAAPAQQPPSMGDADGDGRPCPEDGDGSGPGSGSQAPAAPSAPAPTAPSTTSPDV